MTEANRFPNDPVSCIVWRHVDGLKGNLYNPNHVANQELRLLERSLLKSGWIQPLLVNREGVIIDGFHRWCLSRDSKAIRAKYEGLVPCVEMDIDEGKAMVLTIRINRAKGAHAAIEMSRIVKSLIDEHHWDPAQVALEIGATKDEIDLLYQDDIFKARNLKDHAYSKAWVPYEDGNRHVLK